MKKLFSTSLLILAGMLLLLGSCKEDELPVSGEGNVANNELPVRLAETDYNPDNTYYLLNDNESQDVYFDVPAAPSGTATLLRLSPNHQSYPRPTLAVTAFRYPRLSWLDGRCVQGPGTYSPRHG